MTNKLFTLIFIKGTWSDFSEWSFFIQSCHDHPRNLAHVSLKSVKSFEYLKR